MTLLNEWMEVWENLLFDKRTWYEHDHLI